MGLASAVCTGYCMYIMATTQSTKKPQNEFAARLGWNPKSVAPRLTALGLMAVCGRCGGSGRYSWCQMYGDTCFKCSGAGLVLPRLTAALAKRATELVAAGALAPYLALVARRRAAKERIPGLAAGCKALYNVIAQDYTDEGRKLPPGVLVDSRLYGFQCRNNHLYYGERASGARVPHPEHLSASDVEALALRGELDLTEAERLLDLRMRELAALVQEYRPSLSAQT
jgi:hypothetical protein